MINGKRFFEYVTYYADLIQKLDGIGKQVKGGNPLAKRILSTINTYKGKHRTGDQYVRNLFECAIIYFEDKFGSWKLDEALIRTFFWAYSLRLANFAVKEKTVDNAGSSHDGLFRRIREAVHPAELVHAPLTAARYPGDRDAVSQIEPLVAIFVEQNAIAK